MIQTFKGLTLGDGRYRYADAHTRIRARGLRDKMASIAAALWLLSTIITMPGRCSSFLKFSSKNNQGPS